MILSSPLLNTWAGTLPKEFTSGVDRATCSLHMRPRGYISLTENISNLVRYVFVPGLHHNLFTGNGHQGPASAGPLGKYHYSARNHARELCTHVCPQIRHSELFLQSTVPESRAANLRRNVYLLRTLHPPHHSFGLDVLLSAGVSGRRAKLCHGGRECASTHYEVIDEP